MVPSVSSSFLLGMVTRVPYLCCDLIINMPNLANVVFIGERRRDPFFFDRN